MNTDCKTKIIKIINTNNLLKDNLEIEPSNNNELLEKILFISSKIYEDQQFILKKLNFLEEKINKIELSKKTVKNNELIVEDLVELVNSNLDIDEETTLKALSYRDYRSVMIIFKFYYKNKINVNYSYPIRIIKKRSFEYYANNKWNPDLYGYYSMNTICLNIQNLFIKFNNIDNISMEDFMLNQDFIYKLSNNKYKKEFFKYVIEEVRLNNS
jgi:nuclear transport factor 2 (NTF2) superfamily protein